MHGCRLNRTPGDSNIARLHINYCLLIPKPDNYLQAKPDSWGFRKFISTDFLKSRASQWLPEDNLTIVCDVSIIGDDVVTCQELLTFLFIYVVNDRFWPVSFCLWMFTILFKHFVLKCWTSGGERTLSGSKFPEEGTRSQKPRHKCHKQV